MPRMKLHVQNYYRHLLNAVRLNEELAMQDNAVEWAERLAHGEWLNRRHAVGPARAASMAILARRPICWASVVIGYADGPDIWPSA
jgi:hypothetical protein